MYICIENSTMLYCITYDIKNSSQEEIFLEELKYLGETNQFISNCWFLNSTLSKEDIFKRLKPKLNVSDLLYIGQTNLTNMSGWLPSNSVEWLKEHSY